MNDLGLNGTSYAALGVAIVAMAVAMWRARSAPAYESREEGLERRVRDLESTVATLQRLLYEKQAEIDRLNERLRIVEAETPRAEVLPGAARRVLLVAVGDDAMLQVDMAALRKVQAQTDLRLTRLLPVRKDALERTLERHRKQGTPIKLLHLAVHSGPEGLQFEDGIADGMWLSQHLAGVEVALLAGCQGDVVADLLGVVPAVVSMREPVENRDAMIWSEVFWMAIGQGRTPSEAFETALRRGPPVVSEFVELHL